MSGGLLVFGFLIGMRHALESDHLAAIASLVNNDAGARQMMRIGAIWGLGHTITLLVVGSFAIFMGRMLAEPIVGALNITVGVMLLLLGGDVLRRLHRDRIRWRTHQHAQGRVHWHAFSHQTGDDDEFPKHLHAQPQAFALRALAVGLVHGMAGSAALIVVTLNSMPSKLAAVSYMLLFGIGSIAGMTVLSAALTLPFKAARRVTWTNHVLQAAVGLFSAGCGVAIVARALG